MVTGDAGADRARLLDRRDAAGAGRARQSGARDIPAGFSDRAAGAWGASCDPWAAVTAQRQRSAVQRLFINSFTRCGVSGRRVTAPGRCSASSTAEAIAAPTGLAPPSPAPFKPSGL